MANQDSLSKEMVSVSRSGKQLELSRTAVRNLLAVIENAGNGARFALCYSRSWQYDAVTRGENAWKRSVQIRHESLGIQLSSSTPAVGLIWFRSRRSDLYL